MLARLLRPPDRQRPRAGRQGVANTLAEPAGTECSRPSSGSPSSGSPSRGRPRPTSGHSASSLTRAAIEERSFQTTWRPSASSWRHWAANFDVMEVAMAAVKLAQEASVPLPKRKPPRRLPTGDAEGGRGSVRVSGHSIGRTRRRGRCPGLHPSGAQRRIRPQDLVGAIAGETLLGGRDIRAIEIADRFSLVACRSRRPTRSSPPRARAPSREEEGPSVGPARGADTSAADYGADHGPSQAATGTSATARGTVSSGMAAVWVLPYP